MNKKARNICNRITGEGIFPHQFAFTLLFPLRNIFLSQKKLIHRIELKKEHNILEVGPGPGYFSTKIASALTEGRLVLADIQTEMLSLAKKRMHKRNIKNVEYYLCDGNRFEFADNEFDTIFMVTVFGEIENKHQYMKEFRRILRPGGLLSVSEQAGDPDKMSVNEIRKLADNSGFVFHKFYGSKYNFTINFLKK